MAYNSAAPADTQTIAAGPADIRNNQEALRTGQIVDAGTLKGMAPGNASGNIPVSNGTLCTNLNADKLDGNDATAFATSTHTHGDAMTNSAGFMTAAMVTKLNGITAGAQPNQNAFANVLVGGTTIQADSATDTIEFVAGTNISLTPDATNDRVTINNTYTHPTGDGNLHVPATSTTNNGKVLTAGATAGSLSWTTPVPTNHATTATTYGVATATNYGHAKATGAAPSAAGTAAVGTDNGLYARGDHVHPVQTSVSGSSGSCTGNAATASKLQNAVKINDVPFDGSSDITLLISTSNIAKDFIVNDMNLTPGSGLSVTVGTGTADIAGTSQTIASATNVTLSARKAAIIYATKAVSGVPTLGKIDAVLPAVDSNTVALWDFSNWDGTSVITNSAVGNGLAVANNLTKSGSVNRVDGWIGYGAKGDGATGYFTASNTTNFSNSSGEMEINILFTFESYTQMQNILALVSTSAFQFTVWGNNNKFDYYNGGADVDLGFEFVTGSIYLLTICYLNGQITVKVNNVKVSNFSQSINISSANLIFFKHPQNSTNYNKGTLHFIEVRNKVRTQSQLETISNKLILPSNTNISEILPSNSIALGYARTSSSAVIEIDDSSYKYGRREGATGGNRRVFLGWKYVSRNDGVLQYVYWDNPFGTDKISKKYVYSVSTSPIIETDVDARWGFAVSARTAAKRIGLVIDSGGGNSHYNGSPLLPASGYYGCYAEVIE